MARASRWPPRARSTRSCSTATAGSPACCRWATASRSPPGGSDEGAARAVRGRPAGARPAAVDHARLLLRRDRPLRRAQRPLHGRPRHLVPGARRRRRWWRCGASALAGAGAGAGVRPEHAARAQPPDRRGRGRPRVARPGQPRLAGADLGAARLDAATPSGSRRDEGASSPARAARSGARWCRGWWPPATRSPARRARAQRAEAIRAAGADAAVVDALDADALRERRRGGGARGRRARADRAAGALQPAQADLYDATNRHPPRGHAQPAGRRPGRRGAALRVPEHRVRLRARAAARGHGRGRAAEPRRAAALLRGRARDRRDGARGARRRRARGAGAALRLVLRARAPTTARTAARPRTCAGGASRWSAAAPACSRSSTSTTPRRDRRGRRARRARHLQRRRRRARRHARLAAGLRRGDRRAAAAPRAGLAGAAGRGQDGDATANVQPGASNAKAKRELGWEPRWRAGARASRRGAAASRTAPPPPRRTPRPRTPARSR